MRHSICRCFHFRFVFSFLYLVRKYFRWKLGFYLHKSELRQKKAVKCVVKESSSVLAFEHREPHTVCQRSMFWSKNYKFLKNFKNGQFWFLCQNQLFLAVNRFEIFEFSCLIWSKIVISWFYLGNLKSKIAIFGPKHSNIWSF